MGFLGGYFSSRDSLLVLLEALGSFGGLIFAPIRSSLYLKYIVPPLPGLVTVLSSKKVDQNEARL